MPMIRITTRSSISVNPLSPRALARSLCIICCLLKQARRAIARLAESQSTGGLPLPGTTGAGSAVAAGRAGAGDGTARGELADRELVTRLRRGHDREVLRRGGR